MPRKAIRTDRPSVASGFHDAQGIMQPDATPHDRREAERFYYAGAMWMLLTFVAYADDSDDCQRWVKRLVDECTDFARTRLAQQERPPS